MALTEFHFVLLYPSRLVAVDLLTDTTIYDEALSLVRLSLSSLLLPFS
jgi:hypothetical protein